MRSATSMYVVSTRYGRGIGALGGIRAQTIHVASESSTNESPCKNTIAYEAAKRKRTQLSYGDSNRNNRNWPIKD